MLSLKKIESYLDHTVVLCFILLIFILPIVHTVAIRYILILFPTGLWLINLLIKMYYNKKIDIQRTPLDYTILAFIFMTFLSLITAMDFWYSLKEIKAEVLTVFLLFYVVVNNIRNNEQIKYILTSLLLGTAVFAIYGLFHFFSRGGNLLCHFIREGSFTNGYLSYSIYLSTAFPFSLGAVFYVRKRLLKLLFIILLILNTFCVYITFTRACWIGVLAEVIIFFTILFWGRKKILFILLSIFIIIIFSIWRPLPIPVKYHGRPGLFVDGETLNNTGEERLMIWSFALNELRKQPFLPLGYGIRSFCKKFKQFDKTRLWHTHNIYIEMAMQLGLQGLLVFLFMIAMILLTLGKAINKEGKDKFLRIFLISELAMVVGFFIHLFFTHDYVDDHVLLFWMIMGLGMVGVRMSFKEDAKKKNKQFKNMVKGVSNYLKGIVIFFDKLS
ncbi:MAG: O-antigen ligase family protein [bacterium]